MTRGVKTTFLAAAFLGLGLGGYWGYSEACEASDSLVSGQYIGPTYVAADFARVQFQHSVTEHARQAVMLQIRVLEQLEAADKDFHGSELGLAYTRLAMIEEAAGRPDAEKQALAQARARYERFRTQRVPSQREELTDEKMKTLLKRLDEAADRFAPTPARSTDPQSKRDTTFSLPSEPPGQS